MRRLFLMFGLVLLAGLPAAALAGALEPGQHAPAFKLQDQNGHWRSPADYRGSWLVVYFYPKDFTPGCTTEVCSFRDDITRLRQAGAKVIGISLDDVDSHARFAEKYHVPFPLLADMHHEASIAYGVLAASGDDRYARRTTFLIDPQGRIARIYRNVVPEINSRQVLADLAALKKGAQ